MTGANCTNGHPVSQDQRFCGECGAATQEATVDVVEVVADRSTDTSTDIPRWELMPPTLRSAVTSHPWRSVVFAVLAISAVIGVVQRQNDSTSTAGGLSSDSGVVAVTFKVEGSATGADLTLSDGVHTSQFTGKAIPLHNAETGEEGITFHAARGAFVQLSAQNTDDTGSITCIIEADGVEVDRNTSSGGYTIAGCSASL